MRKLIVALTFAIFVATPLSIGGLARAQVARQTAQQRQIYGAFDAHDYGKAVELIKRFLQASPNDADMLYNLACAHSLLGEFDESAEALLRAFRAGFDDIEHMRRDPDLFALREHPLYKTILEAADKISRERGQSAMDRWREAYGNENYRYEADEKHHLNYATALDATSHREMREMLEKEADQLTRTLFPDPPDYDILIAVPTPVDSNKFFNGDKSVGGMYQHNLKRLVSRDIGASLRHEFFHSMHYRDMEKHQQPHALWIQEGLASLYEDYELSDDGTIRFVPNDRQLNVKARLRSGRLMKWSDLVSTSSEGFMAKAQQLYPMVRSIFEYVADQNMLTDWYRAYVDHFREDRTGTKAFEITFGKSLEDVEKDWRKWVASQPTVNLRIRAGDASLGVRCDDDGSNDGVLITDVVPNTAAADAGIKRGDIVVAIDDRSTRSLMELRKIIASHEINDEVRVRYRRNGDYITVTVRLRPAPGGA